MPSFFDRKIAKKVILAHLRKNQNVPRILSKNPRKCKNLAIKSEKTQKIAGKSGSSQDSRLQPSPPPRNPNHKNSGRKYKINGNRIYKHPKVVVEYGFQPRTKFAAILSQNPYIEFGGSQLVESF